MKVGWFGIAIAFICLALVSSLHFLYVRRKLSQGIVGKISGIPTGFKELYHLAQGMIFLEVLGFLIAFSAAMMDFFS